MTVPVWQNLQGGELDTALGDNSGGLDVTISSPALNSLREVTAPETLTILLDPDAVAGEPEIVVVTAHAAAATTATVTRGAEGTTARAHAIGTDWVHDLTAAQIEALAAGQYPVNVVAGGAAIALPASFNAHDVTMDQNATFTFDAPAEDGHSFLLHLSGAFTPTFPASVVTDAGAAFTYASPSLYSFTTADGGATWVGALIGSDLA